ncbi:MAG: Ig-like domain-containing protein [Ruminococcus sp.]|nr:hypothetical protein [Ruminococcus sp.]MCI5598624.1 Ig-like domain-containing protein [Ruminococcus sp.]MCI6505212.1 Ig-like domain-containing protein [Ruminococcus sp.]
MKKLCSLFLVVLLAFGMQSVVFATETENQSKPYTQSQEFCDAINNYIINLGIGADYGFTLDRDGKYVNLFTVDYINSENSEVKVYDENADYVLFNIKGKNQSSKTILLGEYSFTTEYYFHHTNKTGYCLYKDGKIYSINDAVDKGMIGVATLVEKLPNSTKVDTSALSYSKEFCDAVNKYIDDSGLTSYYFPGGEVGFNVSDIHYGNTVTIYNETADYIIFGIDGVMDAESKELIGNYEFNHNNMYSAYNPCGYCVYKDNKVYSIKSAVDSKIIDVETLAKAIPNTTKIEEPTKPTEPTKPQPTKPVVKTPKISATKVTLKSAQTKILKVTNGTVKTWSTSSKKIATVSKGKVVALTKGRVRITATLTNGKKLTCYVTVTTSPKLSRTTLNLKKGKTATVKLTGKVANINNKYYNYSKVAKIVSKANATSIKVKALKKGTTTLKIRVNGVNVLRLKVKVK